MIVDLITAPVLEPVAVAEMKDQLKMENTADDGYLPGIVKAAREYVEGVTGRAIMTQTWDYHIDCWPSANYIKLPFGKLASVTSVAWKDTDGTVTTLTVTTDYLMESRGEDCGRIVLPYGVTWPSGTLYPSKPITVRFVCGWTTAALVPERLKSAIKMVGTDLYTDRGNLITGQFNVTENKAVERLLAPMRLWDRF